MNMVHLKKWFIFAAVLLVVLTACNKGGHFISDKTYRQQVHNDYLNRVELASGCADELFTGMDTLGTQYREALEFLYAYMPYSDLADYDFDFFYNQVRFAFMAKSTMPWGKDVPEDIFRHFVLPYRVNNEDLDTARMLMYRELSRRVEGMSMEAAALEVNHWCHEHVAYRGADIRTSAPLATMRTSLGRCGEESTFTVTALRSVGIPARQCYTPRWAHCDDNHAWVEVWIYDAKKCSGEWKFLGACEPDPQLNMGWFAEPSSRCMMVHTKAFGRYFGDEDVVNRTSLYSELNLLSHYAPVCKVTARVLDSTGHPQSDVAVKFKLYNYSEYYTLASFKSDEGGCASLNTGFGDLLLWASDGNRYGYAKLDSRVDSLVDIVLSHRVNDTFVDNIDIVPPSPRYTPPQISPDIQASHSQRIATEDSIRNAYVATFYCNRPSSDWKVLPNANLTAGQISAVMQRAEGNYKEITAFLNNHTQHNQSFPLFEYLSTFSDKDMRDIPADVLESHAANFGSRYPVQSEHYRKGILPARISNELVRPWRKPLAEALAKEGIASIEQLKAWVTANISVDDTGNYYHCPISPMGVFRLRHSDAHSRDIFFVAACRALDIPSYIDNATSSIFVWESESWHLLSFEVAVPENPSCTLTLSQVGNDKPQYWTHFTIQRYEDGDFVSLDYENDSRVASFPCTLSLVPGYYCLSTGTRAGDGSVCSRMQFFTLSPNEHRSLDIILRSAQIHASQRVTLDKSFQVIESMATIEDYAGQKGFLFISLGDYLEPSKHLVNELLQAKVELASWGGMVYMLAPSNCPAMSWDIPGADISLWQGPKKDHLEKLIVEALGLKEPIVYPVVAYIMPSGVVSYHSEGYKIGVVEQLLKASEPTI